MWFKSECTTISDHLWDYTAQRLSASATTQIESHLQHCAPCQAEAEAYRQTLGLLGAARSLPVPASQTTWRDLRPSLTPERRPALRSADLLPRLTLAGAGTALAATLLVVFMSGSHRPLQVGYTASGSSHPPIVAVSPSMSSQTPTEVAQDNTSQAERATAFNSMMGIAYSSAFGGLVKTSTPQEKAVVPAPKAPVLRRHNYNRIQFAAIKRASNKNPRSVATSEDAKPQLDGNNVSPRAQQNYVLNPVSSDDETTHRYVISSIPVSQNGGLVASSDEEGRAW